MDLFQAVQRVDAVRVDGEDNGDGDGTSTR